MKKSILSLFFACVGFLCIAQTPPDSLPTTFYGCTFGDNYAKVSGILQENQYKFTVSELGNIIVQGQHGVLDTNFEGVKIWEGIMKFAHNKFYSITFMTDNYSIEDAAELVANFVGQFKERYKDANLTTITMVPYGYTTVCNNVEVIISLNEFNGSYQMVIQFADTTI